MGVVVIGQQSAICRREVVPDTLLKLSGQSLLGGEVRLAFLAVIWG